MDEGASSERQAVDRQSFLVVRPVDRTDPFLWAGLFAMTASVYLTATVVTWMAFAVALRPWERSFNQHWSERVRLSWPVRRSVARLSALIVFPLAIVAGRRIEVLPTVLAIALF